MADRDLNHNTSTPDNPNGPPEKGMEFLDSANQQKITFEDHLNSISVGNLFVKHILSTGVETDHNIRHIGDDWTRYLPSVFLDTATRAKEDKLADEISRLRKEVSDHAAAMVKAQHDTGKAQKEISKLRGSIAELEEKERLNYVLTRIHPEARSRLLGSLEFQKQFLETKTCGAYVMSIDIRRSTDLMLKSRSPELFASFISTFCQKLREIIISHYGVFDKFTGDGVLAFFPDFYSGSDAGYFVIAAADEAHKLFKNHYDTNRHCFVSIIKDIGLGIGVDHGTVNLVQVGDGLTVVGTPVVYACRLGGAPAGISLLNQPAYENIFNAFSAFCTFGETELEVKHEGRHLAYSVRLNGKAYSAIDPIWRSFGNDSSGIPPTG